MHNLLPTSRVRAYLLPTGSGRGDFSCCVDFETLVQELAAGRFRRPCIEIWAARDDIDRRVLAPALRDEFTQQLQQERTQLRAHAERRFLPTLERLSTAKDKAGGLVEKSTIALTSSLMLMFLLTNPIFDLIFLVLAVFSGATGVTKSFRHLQLASKLRGNKKSLGREEKALQAQLDAKNKEFMAALKKMDVKVHPVLERILVNFVDLDGAPWMPEAARAPEEDRPRVERYLKEPRYRQCVPQMYHPLIDVEID